ncbi:uncharacterized protein LOC129927467 [Biomphalaria glabrata]|uniref:Uncharacterized protein LOC129927467 n=1 Tax=Biomphalaria glabrata TaxID=6526 RepID=A0A9W3B048_BIOGL|nr:uncharacterized protein LOC129927467 [Biomphalaria glabrata]
MSASLKLVYSYMALFHVASADIYSAIKSYSPGCQLTLSDFSQNYTQADCSILTANQDAFYNKVQVGFCTEQELENFTATVCGRSSSEKSISDAKTHFYKAFNLVSEKCQRKSIDCVLTSIVSLVLKQQENYCLLMNFSDASTESCYTSGADACERSEYEQLKVAACANRKTNADQRFSTALMSLNPECRQQINKCTRTKTLFIVRQKYCDVVISLQNTDSLNECNGQITACDPSELRSLEHAACNAINLAWSFTYAWNLNAILLSSALVVYSLM